MESSTLEEIKKAILNSTPETKIYFGSDSSVRVKGKREIVATSTVAVIHADGCKGCKVMGFTSYSVNNDYNKSRPFNRMINETYATIDFVKELIPVIGEREIEIHLDINENEDHGSSVAVKAAVGLVQGILMIKPKVKPLAFAASCAADRFEALG